MGCQHREMVAELRRGLVVKPGMELGFYLAIWLRLAWILSLLRDSGTTSDREGVPEWECHHRRERGWVSDDVGVSDVPQLRYNWGIHFVCRFNW